MTSSNPHMSRKKLSGPVLFLVVCTLAGFVLGGSGFAVLFRGTQAEGILSVGYTPDGGGRIPLEQPMSLVTRMTTHGFATQVAKNVHDPALASSLMAAQYGGKGAMRVRILRDGYQVEVTVRNADRQKALDATQAVLDEVVAEHTVLSNRIVEIDDRTKSRYSQLINNALQVDNALATQTTDIAGSADKANLYSMLLAARSQSNSQILGATGALHALETNRPEPTTIVSAPAVLKPMLSMPLQAAVLGALAGFAVGFVLLQMRKMIV